MQNGEQCSVSYRVTSSNLLLLCYYNLNLALTVTFPMLSPSSAGLPNIFFLGILFSVLPVAVVSFMLTPCIIKKLTHASVPPVFLFENYLPLRQPLCCLTVLLKGPVACYYQSFAAKSNRNNSLLFFSVDLEYRFFFFFNICYFDSKKFSQCHGSSHLQTLSKLFHRILCFE